MRIEHNPLPVTPGVSPSTRTASPNGSSFADVLAQAGADVHFTRHAEQRVDKRGLDLDAARLSRLDSAITRAAHKGARNSVVMLDELAVVVDVRNRTVVTAMPGEGGQPRVFTNIDSVVIA